MLRREGHPHILIILSSILLWQLGKDFLHGSDVLLGGNAFIVEPQTLLNLESKATRQSAIK